MLSLWHLIVSLLFSVSLPHALAAPFLSPWGVWLKLGHLHILPYNLMYWRDLCRPVGIHLPPNVKLSYFSVHTWSPLFFIETFFFLSFIYLFIHGCCVFVAALKLSLTGGAGAPLGRTVRASHCSGFSCLEHGLQAQGLPWLQLVVLVALWRVESSQTRDQTHVPCIAGGFFFLNYFYIYGRAGSLLLCTGFL